MAEEVGGIVYEVGMDVDGLKKARNAREMNLDDSLNQEHQQPTHLMVLITQQKNWQNIWRTVWLCFWFKNADDSSCWRNIRVTDYRMGQAIP